MVVGRVMVAVLASIVTVLSAYAVLGQRFAYGPVLVVVSNRHGLHLTDLAVIGLWMVGIAACVVLWRSMQG